MTTGLRYTTPVPNAINIGGMYITDDLNDPDKWQIPTNAPTQTTIPAHGYLLLWADNETTEGPNHVGFKLDKEGEAVGLYRSDLTLVDSIEFGEQTGEYLLRHVIRMARITGDLWASRRPGAEQRRLSGSSLMTSI